MAEEEVDGLRVVVEAVAEVEVEGREAAAEAVEVAEGIAEAVAEGVAEVGAEGRGGRLFFRMGRDETRFVKKSSHHRSCPNKESYTEQPVHSEGEGSLRL